MVVIGVDAHKRTHTLVAVDEVGRKVDEKTVNADSDGHAMALKWVRLKFAGEVLWGLEDCRHVTSRLERDLLTAAQRVVRVPTKLMARTRRSSRTPGKSDPIDALAVARAVLREPNLPIAFHDPQSREVRLLVDRREDLVQHRTATIARLLWRVHELDPAHSPQGASLRRIKHRTALGEWLATQPGLVAELARDELADVTRLTAAIDALEKRIAERVRAVAPTLLAIPGCAELSTAKIVGEVANVTRFTSVDAFAQYAGVAPIPRWSGDTVRYQRPHRVGNRQLNKALHIIAVNQIRWNHPGKAYYQKRIDAGDSPAKARRALKRRIAHAVFSRLHTDQRRQGRPSVAALNTGAPA